MCLAMSLPDKGPCVRTMSTAAASRFCSDPNGADTSPLGRSVHLVLTDICAVADGNVARLTATPAEVSDTASAARVEVPAGCVRVSGLSATVCSVSDRCCTPGGAQLR